MKKVVRNFVLAVMLLVLCAPQIASADTCDHDFKLVNYGSVSEFRYRHQHGCTDLYCTSWSHECNVTRYHYHEGLECSKCGATDKKYSFIDYHSYTSCPNK